jgi:pectate lyase
MARSARHAVTILALLGIPAVLWVTALLFRFRVVNVFHAYLMKFPGPWVVFGTMVVGPLAAVVLGVWMVRRRRSPVVGWMGTIGGAILVVAFVAFIGVPMVRARLAPKTPKNPGTPRPIAPQVGLPVFADAEGFGTRTPAGRGGRVIEVTSLADAGPGTLRAALDEKAPRIIVFRVGGTIEIESELFIAHPFVTVAGQTAPGDGICVKGAGITIFTHDVLLQHLRVRPGNEGPVDADVNDAIAILGKHGEIEGAYNVVVDHVSASWSEDECVSTWYGAHDVTISWSIISEALNRSRHRKRTHSAGLLIGDSSYHVSVHHNLLAHNDFRNPLIIDGGTHDVVNNVIYNWGVLPAEIVDRDGNSFLNFVGNYFLPGPSTQAGPYEILFDGGNPRIFVAGNRGPHRPGDEDDEWALVGLGYGAEGVAPTTCRSAAVYETPPITSVAADEAFEQVLDGAGATLPKRDAADRRVVADVRNRSGSIIDSPTEVGGYPPLDRGTRPIDSDHDGMPDAWEAEHGLDPNNASDGSGDLDGDGYTNVEEFLHSLMER